MNKANSIIFYTLTDESPLLASYSLLPILRTFVASANIEIRECDISLSARILAEFSEYLKPDQRVEDTLGELAKLTQEPTTNIIKLPNISASVNQLQWAITELQEKGFAIPAYPEESNGPDEEDIKNRYAQILGSAVNPVLREGNSDRRTAQAVKRYAQKNPHWMGKWSPASRTHVSHMRGGDFYSSEKCLTLDKSRNVRMELETRYGERMVLKENTALENSEIIDSMFMSKKALCAFYEEQMEDARTTGVMFSLHVKATMMKVSHPIVFGHALRIYYKEAFEKHGELFERLGVNPNNGINTIYEKIKQLPRSVRVEIEHDLLACVEERPELAMVDPRKGITNLHSPNYVIVDASMPAMIRSGGKMYGPDRKLKDTKAVNPESTYARMYQEVINFCKTQGAFDPTTMGTVPNVGLMAKKAEEYGSHDKTFEIQVDGAARIIDNDSNEILLEQQVEKGDIWRMCQTKDGPVRDWVRLAVERTRLSGIPAVFWLDEYRPHDLKLIEKVRQYLSELDTEGLDIQIMSQVRAMRYTLERVIRGKDTISVTGNILRDYLTDLFPIMELGTSAKMLSIVPLLKGGSLFETGAGGTAPMLLVQLKEENHLAWDSLGEFLALGISLEEISRKSSNAHAAILAKTLEVATERLLEEDKSPTLKTGELDNRGSHFYLALFWAEELVKHDGDAEFISQFTGFAKSLRENETRILEEMNSAQGSEVDLGGYYRPDWEMTKAVMQPSTTFNEILRAVRAPK
ncbi:MAG: NADP-dependent isocitrate dehydrogenase [bacterium]|nr:NADP-dependent isocitrate dehydrogenase [bacterium]